MGYQIIQASLIIYDSSDINFNHTISCILKSFIDTLPSTFLSQPPTLSPERSPKTPSSIHFPLHFFLHLQHYLQTVLQTPATSTNWPTFPSTTPTTWPTLSTPTPTKWLCKSHP